MSKWAKPAPPSPLEANIKQTVLTLPDETSQKTPVLKTPFSAEFDIPSNTGKGAIPGWNPSGANKPGARNEWDTGDWGTAARSEYRASQLDDESCRNCGEIGHFSEHCPENRRDTHGSDRPCYHCGQEGHNPRDCLNKRQVGGGTCRNCGQEGHFARECPDRTCRNCGQEGHIARECPDKRQGGRACFNCGQEGHTKAECPNPKVFTGTCRICNKEGHPASACPDKVPEICRNCKQEGHKAQDCKENRVFDLKDVPSKSPEEAWIMIQVASKARNLEEFRTAFKIYSKAVPDATIVDIEKKLREERSSVFIIGLEKATSDCHSLIDLQGKLGCTYVAAFFFTSKPQRASLKGRWPSGVDDNLARLSDAGFPYDRQIPKCSTCGEMGHVSKACKTERMEGGAWEKIEVKCYICSAVGHRARDCTEPRVAKFACRNCGGADHKAADCPEPRSNNNVECRRCHEVGHFAKDCPKGSGMSGPRTCRNCGSEDHLASDCPEPKDMSKVVCRNCDECGHFSRECPKKRDYSRVKCHVCGEMGHTKTRCPRAEESGENEAPHEASHEASELSEFVSGSDNPSTAPADKNDMSGW